MSDHETPRKETVVPISKLVRCRRTGQEFDTTTHTRCPYCYGSKDDVATGDHSKFCDFKPGEDPVCFGFPGTSSRERRG